MKDLFPGYYSPSAAVLRALWKDAEFAFDANVLLNVYRYPASSRKRLIAVLVQLKDRLWLPHQAALEYHQNFAGVVTAQEELPSRLSALLRDSLERLRADARKYRKNRIIDISKELAPVELAVSRVQNRIERLARKAPSQQHVARLESRLSALFSGRVGPGYEGAVSDEKRRDAESRLSANIPPGYRDKDKGARAIGDVLLWFQLLDRASDRKRPIIFVTDDRKEDWWFRLHGKTIGPRPELVQEMMARSGTKFYMYSGEQFLEQAERHLGIRDKRAVIEKARWMQMIRDAAYAMTASPHRDQVEGATGHFGYDSSNPIPGEQAPYCASLRCPAGHPFYFHRTGSLGKVSPDGHIVDSFDLVCFGGEFRTTLFMDMYHRGTSTIAPYGLSLGPAEGRGTSQSFVRDFPDELKVPSSAEE